MSRETLGLARRQKPVAASPRRRPSRPPFRGSRGAEVEAAAPDRRLAGLEHGAGLSRDSGRSRQAGFAISAAIHLLLAVFLFGGITAFPPPEPVEVAEGPEEEPLLYTFAAEPLEEPELLVEAVPEAPLPEPEPVRAPEAAEPVPPRPALSAPIVIPEAQIAVPNTGFQNDLPFSDGDSEEFYVDEEMGEDPESEASASETLTEPEPEPEQMLASVEPTPPAETLSGGAPLRFDSDAFRRAIQDPAAGVRERRDELAMETARRLAEEERRKEGRPTDIWRFLDGKRFRNPEGGLVSNRNNTLYYDDRGANLVPWIGRLIAEVRRNWYIPYAASYQAGHVAIAISVLRSGQLDWLQVVIPSGVPGFDNAAVGALRGAQLLPLPDDYPGRDFEIMLVFWYNEQPYDLFNRSP